MRNNPEKRINELTGETVILSSVRAHRPFTFHEDEEVCPFCPGNEGLTPGTVYESEDGRVRIFENKYPIFDRESESAYGYHYVLSDTNVHSERLDAFSREDIYKIFIGLRDRSNFLRKDEKIKYVQIFKNEGAKAGASIAHSHWQIAAAPYIPVKQTTMAKNADKYFNERIRCYGCDLLRRQKDYIFYENESFAAFCPSYSKYSYEIDIMPKRHRADLLDFSDAELLSLADALKVSLSVLKQVQKEFNYNICLYDTVLNDTEFDYDRIFHFNMQIVPHSSNMAGFELSTDSWINSILPEEAVEKFRTLAKELKE